ncbi:MAG: hypothetical protein ACI4I2_12640 [Oscillospiraceae bacterium]
MQFKFKISMDSSLSDFDVAKDIAKTHLNYGWEFVKIEETKNENFPYRVTLNWKNQGVPDVPPYSDKIHHISEER